MAITIKNERVVAKIRVLAGRLNTDQVGAVERAVDALAGQLPESEVEQRLHEVLDQLKTLRTSLTGMDLTTDDLYDEAGLPR